VTGGKVQSKICLQDRRCGNFRSITAQLRFLRLKRHRHQFEPRIDPSLMTADKTADSGVGARGFRSVGPEGGDFYAAYKQESE
jgi:hypothetical protein